MILRFRDQMRQALGYRATQLGYRATQWVRVAQTDDWMRFLASLPPSKMDALEISPPEGGSHWGSMGFSSYSSVQFPAFDITKQTLERTFDVVIAEQVFEHLRDPYSAARNVWRMLKDDGIFMIATPRCSWGERM